jgi:hypothetical protein
MTIFVAHAPANQAVAEDLEKFIERRGQFVELDDGQTAMRPVQSSDVVILLLSKNFVLAPTRLRLEQRALDAWSEGRLVTVKLDHSIAPVGLRDLPAIDASFEAQREFTWQKVTDAAREQLRARAPASADGDAAPPSQAPPAARKKGGGILGVLGLLLLTVPGFGAIAAAASIWLVNRIGPTPGGLPELRQGIDSFGTRYGVPGGITEWLFVAAIALTLIILFSLIARLFKRKPPGARVETRAEAPASTTEDAPAPTQGQSVFVSYARANAKAVLPVIEGATEEGRKFWLDQQGIGAGEGWAGEIVRAIRGATGVVVMCSKAAFESDHVKREIYLADRYHKKLVPVFIEDAQPPEDFEYFFAGVQWLKLFETPEAERPQALVRALGAAT